jgi:hypothetical protein
MPDDGERWLRVVALEHWEYDAELPDGYDHDIGAALLRSAAARSTSRSS